MDVVEDADDGDGELPGEDIGDGEGKDGDTLLLAVVSASVIVKESFEELVFVLCSSLDVTREVQVSCCIGVEILWYDYK